MGKKDKLTKAIEDGNLDLVKKYANKKNINRKINPPLSLAVKNNYPAITQFLIDLGANRDNSLLSLSAEFGHTEMVEIFLNSFKSSLTQSSIDSALIKSSKNGHTETTESLIQLGANIHARDNKAFLEAARHGHIDTTKLLIKKGADIHACDNEAFIWTASYDRIEILKILLKELAVDQFKTCTNIALEFSAINNNVNTVEFLIIKGADIHYNNNIALRSAAVAGALDTIALLINSGANIHADHNGALRNAILRRHIEVARFLILKGADIRDVNGSRALNFIRPILSQIEESKEAIRQKQLHNKDEELLEIIKEAIELNMNNEAIGALAKLSPSTLKKLAGQHNFSCFIIANWSQISQALLNN